MKSNALHLPWAIAWKNLQNIRAEKNTQGYLRIFFSVPENVLHSYFILLLFFFTLSISFGASLVWMGAGTIEVFDIQGLFA